MSPAYTSHLLGHVRSALGGKQSAARYAAFYPPKSQTMFSMCLPICSPTISTNQCKSYIASSASLLIEATKIPISPATLRRNIASFIDVAVALSKCEIITSNSQCTARSCLVGCIAHGQTDCTECILIACVVCFPHDTCSKCLVLYLACSFHILTGDDCPDNEHGLVQTAFCIQIHHVKHAPRLSSLHGPVLHQ